MGGATMACRVISLFMGMATTRVSLAPFGSCSFCCPIDVNAHIKFKLYTSENPTSPDLLIINDVRRFARSHFNPADPTVIFLHGWAEAAPGTGPKAVRDGKKSPAAYLRSGGGYNVILVDWSPLVTSPWYFTSVNNTPLMGDVLAKFIRFILEEGADVERLHVIGFSLGAQAAGMAAKTLKEEGVYLRRITGLDPAYPGFDPSPNGRLSKGDAMFVDVIHSNPGLSGLLEPIGDVDFYPNNPAVVQPGCSPFELVELGQLDRLNGCSHNRAWHYYAESVLRPHGFPATKCPDWRGPLAKCKFSTEGYMGIAATPQMHGKMYLWTNQNSPYGRNGP